eukprot:gene9910-7099_t
MLIALWFVLLVATATEVIYDWGPMQEESINRYYFPYERCVLGLSDADYDKSATIFKQPACMHHLNTDSLLMSKISDRCWLGGKQQRQDDGICVGNTGGSDVIRGRKKYRCYSLSERPSLLYGWHGLPPAQHSPAVDLMNAVLDKSFELIIFVGDSMANQLGQRLLCSALRSNLSVTEYGKFFSMPSTGASAKIAHIPSSSRASSSTNNNGRSLHLSSYRLHNGLGCTTLHERQSGSIPGVSKECTSPDGVVDPVCVRRVQSEFIYSRTASGFRLGPKWKNTLHVFVLPIKLKFEWEYVPLCKALLEVAQQMKASRSSLVVVSPFAQHFKSHPIGLYENFTKPAYDERSCGPHQTNHSRSLSFQHPESERFLRTMDTLDPHWRDHVGFFNLFPWTTPMHDLHSEGHSTGWSVDCTHFIFQPTMFDAIWVAFRTFVTRTISL